MAKQKGNYVMKGVSGKLGDQVVFTLRNGETNLSRIAQPRTEDSVAQEATLSRFKRATLFAKGAVLDPILNAYYEKRRAKNTNAYATAIKDYCDTPVIKSVITIEYTGLIGSVISIVTKANDFIKHMPVSITDANGVQVETGFAMQHNDSAVWEYFATQNNTALLGSNIMIEVADHPGNTSSMQVQITA